MKYLNFVLSIIAIFLLGLYLRLCVLDIPLKSFNDNIQAVTGSNQALINSNARLEAAVTDLKKEVSSIKETFSKR